jgi:hypothetical protein
VEINIPAMGKGVFMNKKRGSVALVLLIVVTVALFAVPGVCNYYKKDEGIRVLVDGDTVEITSTVSSEKIVITSFTIKGKDHIRKLSRNILEPFESATAKYERGTRDKSSIAKKDVDVSAQTCE